MDEFPYQVENFYPPEDPQFIPYPDEPAHDARGGTDKYAPVITDDSNQN